MIGRLPRNAGIFALGALSLVPYAYALSLQDLREHTHEFLLAYLVAFALYAGATVLALRTKAFSREALAMVFVLGAVMMAVLVFSRPTLSDDMYRYLWDGRVQWQGISPYRFPPGAAELEPLRDPDIWPHINRKGAVTIYPPAAQMAFAALWRLVPDSVRWFQVAMVVSGLLAGGLLVGLLRDLGRSPARVILYLWSPLLVFELAHGAHVDGLVLPFLVGAWWARVRRRDALVGLLLGFATAIKLYPAILLPALWRPQDSRGRWTMPAAFVLALGLSYAPHVLRDGPQVLGFLPDYLGERFNMGLAALLVPLLSGRGVNANQALLVLTLGVFGLIGLAMLLRPAADGEAAVRRSIWLMGAFTLLSQNLFSWYLLWVLPLAAIFVRPGRLLGLRADAWTGWWLFCGLVGLSYTFFLRWRPVPWAIWAQFLPLYLLLGVDVLRKLRARLPDAGWTIGPQPRSEAP